MRRLKRIGRYLVTHRRAALEYKYESKPTEVYVECDSDFGGDIETRRSTTGLVVMVGGHCLRTQSSLQSTVSLSSGEAEYYAAVQGAAAGLGLAALMSDWGVKLSVAIGVDSSAACGITNRRGIGRIRHIATRWLWLQERVASKEVRVQKISTDANRADALTKGLSADRLRDLCRAMGLRDV